MNATAVPAVSRVRKFPAPEPPNTVCAPELPNARPMPPPLPAWSSTTRMRNTHTSTCRMVISVTMTACSYRKRARLANSEWRGARPPSKCPAHDGHERLRVERRPADQRPVHVGAVHELLGVLRLDRPAVLDAHLVGDLAPAVAQLLADEAVRLVRLSDGGRPPRADRPHRLVGDDQPGRVLAVDVGERAVELRREPPEGLAGVALVR